MANFTQRDALSNFYTGVAADTKPSPNESSLAFETDTLVLSYYDGAVWQTMSGSGGGISIFSTDDANNNTITTILTLIHNTTGASGNNIGVGLDFSVETSTTVDTLAGSIDVIWSDATHATRRSDMIFSVENDNDGTMEEFFRLTGADDDIDIVKTLDANNTGGRMVAPVGADLWAT